MKDGDNEARGTAAERERTLAMALSTWDLERTRRDRPNSPRSRVVLLRAHQRLQEGVEARKGVPPAKRSSIKIRDESRTACLLIHDTHDSPADFRSLAEHLYRNGLTVYALLLPEHGKEDSHEVMWRACQQEVRLRFRLLRRAYNRVYVIGQGFGATLAILLAAKESVPGLALLAPALVPRVSLVERLLFRLGIHRIVWLRPRLGWTEELLTAMKRARARISRLRTPVYAAQCDDDESISPVSLRILQKSVRHKASRFHVFPTGGHAILEAHGESTLNAEIYSFIRGRK